MRIAAVIVMVGVTASGLWAAEGRPGDGQAAPSQQPAPDAPSGGGRQKVTSGDVTIELPLGLQADAIYVPEENPLSKAKVELGRLLYFETRISKDKTLSCASCHNPWHGFAEPRATSQGVGGLFGKRNSPTVINRLFSKEQFWDGRAADLEAQAHGPLTNPIEMAMPSHDEVVKRLTAIPGYAPLFEKAFGSKEITMARAAQAIASYERTVVSGNSAYDRYQAGQKDALSAEAVRGLALFNGKANCVTCHAGFNFTDESYHNLGVGMTGKDPDVGRFAETKAESEKGAFKTPTLRNIVQTPPYMHDGSEPTLLAVVAFYDKGGNPNPTLAKEVQPLKLTAQEKQDLVAFMEALTGDVENLVPPSTFPK
jgi:cytochrome c peroxidase